MGLTRALFALLAVMLTAAAPLAAQNAVSLVTEIQNIEQMVNHPGVGGAERRGALIRLARLYQLTGNLEGAAWAWTSAASAEAGAGTFDGASLLEGALAYIAIGEYDRARSNINAALSVRGEAQKQARYTAALLEAFSRGALTDLTKLLEDNEYRDYRPAIWYTLWRISGDTAYQARLLAEYPASPEGRLAAGNSGPVGPASSAMWLLFPGRESVVLGPSFPVQAAPVSSAGMLVPMPVPVTPGTPSLLPPVTTNLAELIGGQAQAAVLQAGLFSREENAQAMAGRLRTAGFSASLSRRRVNGADYWTVTVPAGADVNQTIMRLKDKGFESFPVF